MDITPITELREQLRSAAVAGTNLLSEDFRLKKAVDAFAPLKDASPVFGKIYELSGALVSGNCEDAAGTLLDALSLVDSVMTTLANVDVEGEVESLPAVEFPARIINVPYSSLSKIINALTKPGSGQSKIIWQANRDKTELFEDYRVQPALIKGLGASSGELVDLVYKIIEDLGKQMLPLLKKGFDPKGKKETFNRIKLIDELGGAQENDFYLENLPLTEKEAKKLLIRALRHDADNADKLIELIQTEKGAVKGEALCALARLDCGKAQEYFEEMEKKKPQETLEYITHSRAAWACRLAVKIGSRLFDNTDGGEYKMNGFGVPDINFFAFQGKTGRDVEDFFRKLCAADVDKLQKNYILEQVNGALLTTVATTGDPGMCALTLELEKKYPDQFEEAAFYARLTGTEDCTDWLKKKILEAKAKAQGQGNKKVFYTSVTMNFKKIKCVDGQYFITYIVYDNGWNSSGTFESYATPIHQPIKEKFIDMLIECDWYMADDIMAGLFDPDDEDMREKIKPHYVEKVVAGDDERFSYCRMMERCGIKNVKGLIVDYFKKNQDRIDDPYVYIANFPGDLEYKLKELEEVAKLVENGELKDDGFDVESLFAPWAISMY